MCSVTPMCSTSERMVGGEEVNICVVTAQASRGWRGSLQLLGTKANGIR